MIIESLPESAQELANVIGLTGALALLALLGGVRLSVPKRFNDDHWIVEAIGPEPARKLMAYYGGEDVELPTCIGAGRAIRNANILSDSKQGMSGAALALKYGMTGRSVRKILAQFKATT